MAESMAITDKEIRKELLRSPLAREEDLDSVVYPCLRNISAGMMFRFLPHPTGPKPPEYVYIPPDTLSRIQGSQQHIKALLTIAKWNFVWEVGHLRGEMFKKDLKGELSWLKRYSDQNIYLVPGGHDDRYEAHSPLYHLLPRRTLERYGLPLLKAAVWPWPTVGREVDMAKLGYGDFDLRLSNAFAFHVWTLLCSQSPPSAFTKDDPLVLLSHNLDFWLPYAIRMAEDRLRTAPRVRIENKRNVKLLSWTRSGARCRRAARSTAPRQAWRSGLGKTTPGRQRKRWSSSRIQGAG